MSNARRAPLAPPRRSSPLAWWFGGAALLAAGVVLMLYVQLVHAAVERGALARAAPPLATVGALAAADGSRMYAATPGTDPFGPEARRAATRALRSLRATPTALPAAGRAERRLADSAL